MKDVMGLIYTSKHETSLRELTASRAVAALPVGGRYRMIDFMLSSMVNSGIRNAGVIMQKNYHSLMDHLGSGKEWDLHGKNDGLYILPPFLNLGTLGLNYGMQACQFTATSTTAECQTLAMPNYVHSIPNNNDNQDIVSMGTNSALLAKTVIENSYQVMAIQFMGMAQAIDYLKIQDRLSPKSRQGYEEIRSFFPVFTNDTPKYKEIERMMNYLKKENK